jgi:hypothetical protein
MTVQFTSLTVISKLVIQEVEGVGCWRTIELGTILEIRAAIQGFLHDFGSFVIWKWWWSTKTCQKH